jgi:hypothetical protein
MNMYNTTSSKIKNNIREIINLAKNTINKGFNLYALTV